MDGTETKAGDFVLDARFNREPMEVAEVGGDVIASRDSTNEPSCIVLQLLETLNDILCTVYKDTVAVIKAREYEGRH